MANEVTSPLFIGLGTPTVAVSTLTILSIGEEGDPSALGLLTHPLSGDFAPITYQRNPDFTTNLDNEVWPAPDAQLIKTSTSSKLVRTEGLLADVVCDEGWIGQAGSRAAMRSFFARQLYEYLINPPAFSATAQTFIVWQPRYRSNRSYNVEFYKMVIGSGSGAQVFNAHELRGAGVVIQSPFDGGDVSPSGLIDQPVTISLHIVSEV